MKREDHHTRPSLSSFSPRENYSGPFPPNLKGRRSRNHQWLKKYFRRVLKWLGFIFGTLVTLGLISACVSYTLYGRDLPSIEQLALPKRPPNIAVYYANGGLIANRGKTGGQSIELKELPWYVPLAFVAIEDRRFFEHFGFDFKSILRAAYSNILNHRINQGGSTITQQLAKNVFLTSERSFKRKTNEIIIALWLEHRFTKLKILELYINRVYFGAGAFGIDAAAHRYFNKPAPELTISEAAMLAGLVKAPSRLNPFKSLALAQQRSFTVLKAMHEEKYLDKTQYEDALTHPAHPVVDKDQNVSNYIADYVMDLLGDFVPNIDYDLAVITTINSNDQHTAEEALAKEINEKGKRYRVTQGAMVALTPDGAIRALVGGVNYNESQFNRATSALRQPGSTFKPFIYLTALNKGLTPDTIRDDEPIDIEGWTPKNVNKIYHGPVTLQEALSRSYNTVAVRLAMELSPSEIIKQAHQLGITSSIQSNASIALGTSEVTPLELIGAYCSFANGGTPAIPYIIKTIKNSNEQIVYDHKDITFTPVMTPEVNGMINAMLREVFISGTGKRAQIEGWELAGKSGTTQHYRDGWFIGYSSTLVAGVWLGNDDNSPMRNVYGSTLPREIWQNYMKQALQNQLPVPLKNIDMWYQKIQIESDRALLHHEDAGYADDDIDDYFILPKDTQSPDPSSTPESGENPSPPESEEDQSTPSTAITTQQKSSPSEDQPSAELLPRPIG